MLIGLTGAAGSGKNTVADLLGWRQMAFAQPLYRMLSAMTGLPVEELQDRSRKEAVIPWLGKSPRQLLQSLGTEWGRDTIGPDVWVNATLMHAKPMLAAGENIVITDVRFDNEAIAIIGVGGRVFRVVRPGHGCLAATTASHVSEAGVSDHLVTAEIRNDGPLDALRAAAEAVILE